MPFVQPYNVTKIVRDPEAAFAHFKQARTWMALHWPMTEPEEFECTMPEYDTVDFIAALFWWFTRLSPGFRSRPPRIEYDPDYIKSLSRSQIKELPQRDDSMRRYGPCGMTMKGWYQAFRHSMPSAEPWGNILYNVMCGRWHVQRAIRQVTEAMLDTTALNVAITYWQGLVDGHAMVNGASSRLYGYFPEMIRAVMGGQYAARQWFIHNCNRAPRDDDEASIPKAVAAIHNPDIFRSLPEPQRFATKLGVKKGHANDKKKRRVKDDTA